MDDLIEALTIFRKYTDTKYPTTCEHDTLFFCGVEPEKVSSEDKARLSELGVDVDEDLDSFFSHRFGSC